MSTDIATCPQRKIDGVWKDVNTRLFEGRQNDFDLFCFLGFSRQVGVVPPIFPLRGLPDDYADAAIFEESLDDCSWFTISELIDYDYSQTFEERRTWIELSPRSFVPGPTLLLGQGIRKSVQYLLGRSYFDDLERAKIDKVERIIVGFC